MLSGPPPAEGLPRKDLGKTPVFEKICKAIAEGLPLENDKLRTTDEGQARMKKFLEKKTFFSKWANTFVHRALQCCFAGSWAVTIEPRGKTEHTGPEIVKFYAE
jgi:hypothetical protein